MKLGFHTICDHERFIRNTHTAMVGHYDVQVRVRPSIKLLPHLAVAIETQETIFAPLGRRPRGSTDDNSPLGHRPRAPRGIIRCMCVCVCVSSWSL